MDKLSKPKVSVIVLNYNNARYLDQLFEGFQNQTLTPHEIVVVDDCSTDNSKSVIDSFVTKSSLKIKVIYNDANLGICKNINKSLEITNGEFVCIMAGDDWPEPNFLLKMSSALESQSSNTAFAYADVNRVSVTGELLSIDNQTSKEDSLQLIKSNVFQKLLSSNFIEAPATMIRREALINVGKYDENLFFEDYDMWLRLSDNYESVYVPERLVNYRVHGLSVSHNVGYFDLRKKSIIKILQKWVNQTRENDRIIALQFAGHYSEILDFGSIDLQKSANQLVHSFGKFALILFLLRLQRLRFNKKLEIFVRYLKNYRNHLFLPKPPKNQ